MEILSNEIWKDIRDYEGFYKASPSGSILSLHKNYFGKNASRKTNKTLSQHIDKNGYVSVVLVKNKIKKTQKLHRLIAMTFIDNPKNKPCVNHINGIKTDNRVENLEWVSYSENELHAIATGLKNHDKIRGENSCNAILNKEKATEIKKMIENGVRSSDIARMFKVSPQLICDIKKGRRWSD